MVLQTGVEKKIEFKIFGNFYHPQSKDWVRFTGMIILTGQSDVFSGIFETSMGPVKVSGVFEFGFSIDFTLLFLFDQESFHFTMKLDFGTAYRGVCYLREEYFERGRVCFEEDTSSAFYSDAIIFR